MELLDFENVETQTLAMQILLKSDDEEVLMNSYSKAKKFKGQALANYISLFSNRINMANEELRRKRDELLVDVFKNGDEETINKMTGQMIAMSINPESALNFVESYCSNRDKEKKSEGRRMINMRMEIFARRNGLDFRDVCMDVND